MSAEPDPYRILFVCTANICRSPTAEALARHRYGERSAVFRSAGFLDAGASCPSLLLQSVGELGVDLSQHLSYHIDTASLDAADLVLTMEGSHVQEATLLRRECFPKIMPLKEAASAVTKLGAGALDVDDLVAEVNRDRDPTRYLTGQWDVADPYGRKLRDYRRAVSEIDSLVTTVIGALV